MLGRARSVATACAAVLVAVQAVLTKITGAIAATDPAVCLAAEAGLCVTGFTDPIAAAGTTIRLTSEAVLIAEAEAITANWTGAGGIGCPCLLLAPLDWITDILPTGVEVILRDAGVGEPHDAAPLAITHLLGADGVVGFAEGLLRHRDRSRAEACHDIALEPAEAWFILDGGAVYLCLGVRDADPIGAA